MFQLHQDELFATTFWQPKDYAEIKANVNLCKNKRLKVILGTNVTEITDKADTEDELMKILPALEMLIENDDERYKHRIEKKDNWQTPSIAYIHHHAQNDNDTGVNLCKNALKTQKGPATNSINETFNVDENEEEQ